MQITLKDIPKYVIHNVKRKDRAANCAKQFGEFFTAEEQQPIVFPAIMHSDTNRWSSKIGCWMSHQEVVRLAKESKAEYVMVFEDDVMFEPNGKRAREWTDECLLKVPESFDLLLLGIYTGSFGQCVDGWCKIGGQDFSGAQAYILSARAFDKILAFEPKEVHRKWSFPHYDRWLNSKKGGAFECYVMNPMCAHQTTGYSDLLGAVCDYHSMTDGYNILK